MSRFGSCYYTTQINSVRILRWSQNSAVPTVLRKTGFPFNLTSTFLGGHDFVPGQYPDVLAPPHNWPCLTMPPVPRPWGGAPNVAAIAPAAETSAVQTSVTNELSWAGDCTSATLWSRLRRSPPQSSSLAEAPLVATTAEGAPLIPMFVPPMQPGARKAQRDKPAEKGYGPPIPGTIMRQPPSGG